MTATATADARFARLVQRIAPQGTLVRAWALQGGVSARVTALEIARPDGRTEKVVVRRHGAVDRAHNPQVGEVEFGLLDMLRGAGVAAPRPYHLDRSGEIFPEPYIVIEYIEGQPEFAPTDVGALTAQLAAALGAIHRVDCSGLDRSFLPRQEERFAARLRERAPGADEAGDERRIREALAGVWPLPQRNSPVLLHGDFWPGNVLWNAGRLVAVIDWEDAAFGDPLADLANARLEMLWAFGLDTMEDFTEHYVALAVVDRTDLPYWDLCAALRPAAALGTWGLDEGTEKAMRAGLGGFIDRALDRLGER